MKSSLVAPRTGPGYSTGQKSPKVSTTQAAHPKASAGNKAPTGRGGDPKSTVISGSSPKAGDHAMLRKGY